MAHARQLSLKFYDRYRGENALCTLIFETSRHLVIAKCKQNISFSVAPLTLSPPVDIQKKNVCYLRALTIPAERPVRDKIILTFIVSATAVWGANDGNRSPFNEPLCCYTFYSFLAFLDFDVYHLNLLIFVCLISKYIIFMTIEIRE